jgi:hypothetical protein
VRAEAFDLGGSSARETAGRAEKVSARARRHLERLVSGVLTEPPRASDCVLTVPMEARRRVLVCPFQIGPTGGANGLEFQRQHRVQSHSFNNNKSQKVQ